VELLKKSKAISLFQSLNKCRFVLNIIGYKFHRNEKEFEETNATGGVGLNVLWKYIRAGSSICTLIIFLFTNILTQAFYSGSDYWLQLW
jgi:spore maturation protein CgeB